MPFWDKTIKSSGGGGLTQVYTDATLTGLGTLLSPLSVVGGAGFQRPTSGAIDGSNKTFIWAVTPNSIVLDGGQVLERVQSDGSINWTVSGSAPTVTTILTNAPNFDIFSNA